MCFKEATRNMVVLCMCECECLCSNGAGNEPSARAKLLALLAHSHAKARVARANAAGRAGRRRPLHAAACRESRILSNVDGRRGDARLSSSGLFQV